MNDSCQTDAWWDAKNPGALVQKYSSPDNWPWQKLTPSQFLFLWKKHNDLSQYNNAAWQFRTLFNIDYALSFFGILGSIFSLITLANSEYSKQPSYMYHRAIAACDLLYNLLYPFHSWCHLNPSIVARSYTLCIARIVIKVSDSKR